jgi:M6 family metalloprotease-like protein
MEYYGCGDEGDGSVPPCSNVTTPSIGANGNYLARDAIIAARSNGLGGISGHTGLINVDNGGTFDAVIIIHAGNGNETTIGTPGDMWSIFYSQDPDIIGGQSDPVTYAQAVAAGFSEADMDPETESGAQGVTSPFGVMCHEFGHMLGLPDLYNTTVLGGSSVVGRWELMDMGPYDGPSGQGGTNPAHMCAWDKMTLGWVTPAIGTSNLSVSLNYIETNPSLLKIPIQTGLPQEYFLVEYRSPSDPAATFDKNIPGEGLLIWHIDDAITSSRGINATAGLHNTVNSGFPHYGVSIITADGVTIGPQNLGDAGNPFENGMNFITPASDDFSGLPSGISLVKIAGVGSATATSQVTNITATAGQNILKLINYPNPAGKGYPHPSGAGHTTIQIQLTRPANDLSIQIYTLNGDLVKKIGLSDVTLNLNRSTNNQWVYEYVWDLTNGNGAMVAPGVYLYLLRADGSTQSNKAVIIR